MGSRLNRPMVQVSDSVRLFVDTTVHERKVVVFSKTYCPYCTKAKNVLKKYPIDPDQYEVIELEKRPDGAEIQAYMREITGASSVPRVFINGQCIGGGDDTAQLDQEGQLVKLLQECGALRQ